MNESSILFRDVSNACVCRPPVYYTLDPVTKTSESLAWQVGSTHHTQHCQMLYSLLSIDARVCTEAFQSLEQWKQANPGAGQPPKRQKAVDTAGTLTAGVMKDMRASQMSITELVDLLPVPQGCLLRVFLDFCRFFCNFFCFFEIGVSSGGGGGAMDSFIPPSTNNNNNVESKYTCHHDIDLY